MTMIRHENPGRSARIAGVLLFAVLASACGENLFETDNPPELNEFTASAETVVEGDTIVFNVDASGPRSVEQIRVVLSGAMVDDITFQLDDPGTEVTETFRLPVPLGTGPSSEVTATASAIDALPDTSTAVSTTVTITDATDPTVAVNVTPTEVGAGDLIEITVDGADNRGLASVEATVSNGVGYDTTLTAPVAGGAITATETLELVVPAIDMGGLTVTASATDVNGLTASAAAVDLQVTDQKGPTFLSLETSPDSTIPLNDSVQVTVELTDPSGIQRVSFVGLAYRGVPSMGTDEVVERFALKTIEFPRPTEPQALPTTYTLNPYLNTNGEEITEPVEIVVVAEDALGNVSDTTKLMYVGGPDVAVLHPPEDYAVGVGDVFNVRIAIDDGTGIDSARVELSGSGIPQPIYDLAIPSPSDEPFVVEQAVTMPASAGVVELRAVAWNTSEVSGQSRTVSIEVLSEAPSDTEPPVVSVTTERLGDSNAGDRMELGDEVRITVSAFDANSGLARIGLKAFARRGGLQHEITDDRTFAGSKSLEQLVFEVPVDSLYRLIDPTLTPADLDSIMPEDIDLLVHGFAADTTGQVACSVGIEEQRDCEPAGYSSTEFYAARDTVGLLLDIEAVRGVTVLLDNRNAEISDLAVDTTFDRLYLSNTTENLVEVLNLDADFRQNAFRSPSVQVGSEPFGLFLGQRVVSSGENGFGGIGVTPGTREPTLIVANSGGTNMSLVHVDPNPGLVQEVDIIRLKTDNAVLFEIEEQKDEFGSINFEVEYLDFADRPQFLAQDSLLRVVYSTIGTDAAPTSSVRFVHADPDPLSATDQPEVRFLLNSAMVDPASENHIALANIDSLYVKPVSGGSDSVRIFTHEPGYPNNIITNATYYAQVADAVADVEAQILAAMTANGNAAQAPLFYPFILRGQWDVEELGWSETTFVSASGNGGRIAVGEGGSTPTGRIMLWHASDLPVLSSAIQMTDLVNNASEEVLGIGLNEDGSLGVARGREATYFFTPDLRLQGLYRQEELGGAGAAFHPEHDEVGEGGHTTTDGSGVAFTGTSQNSIDVVNTFHFNEVSSIVIRDDIVGPLVSGPPLATDNGGQGGACVANNVGDVDAQRDCVVAKLYGITSAGGVVVVNVRHRDLDPAN